MKRKYIQGIEPVLPATEEKEFTVKVENDMILIWRWETRIMTGLYVICAESGEHELLEQGNWQQAKLAALLGQKRYGPYYTSCMEPCTFSGEVSEACALIIAHLHSYGSKNLERLIAAKEDEYSAAIRAQRKEKACV